MSESTEKSKLGALVAWVGGSMIGSPRLYVPGAILFAKARLEVIKPVSPTSRSLFSPPLRWLPTDGRTAS
ncbi:hypothetical protein [Pseudomonas sp. B21-015]|uniref:hypothetical protein n=1 Tax=Pseudomonas sp. B21-015 TaxID=2895473 RepID=UPI0038D50850